MSTIVEETTTDLPPFETWPVAPHEPTIVDEANRLDRLMPGWHERIDIARLDLTDPKHCVLGQAGAGCNWTPYTTWRARVDEDAWGRDETIPNGAYFSNHLHRAAWIREIEKRRA